MKTFQVSKASIGHIVAAKKKHLQDSTPKVPKKRGRKSLLTAKVLLFALEYIEENPQLILKQIVAKVSEVLNIDTSISAMKNALDKMEITCKNILPIPID
jgi:transposase